MNRKVNFLILTAATALACVSCDKGPGKVETVEVPATRSYDVTPASAPAVEWVDISKDEPVDFKTPLGPDFKIKKSGLAWRVINEGHERPVAEVGRKIEIKYTIYHMDMTVIQSNDDPKMVRYMFTLGAKSKDILPFWHEAVLGMTKFGKKRLIVPPQLAYGHEGRDTIKPDETLVIDIEVDRVYGFSRAEDEEKMHAATMPATLPADLIIEDVKVGDGAYLKPGLFGTFKYTGKLDDGSTFDSGDAFSFKSGSGSVIEGWELGVSNMREGGIRKVTIPSRLGYGPAGKGTIPPNATLHFELELKKVEGNTP